MKLLPLLPAILMVGCAFAAPLSEQNSRDRNFDSGWLFYRGDAAGAEKQDFNDSAWRALDLPHDWSIEDAPPLEDKRPFLIPAADGWKFSRGDDATWSAREFDDSGWTKVTGGTDFDSLGYKGTGNYGWFRCKVVVPADLKGKDFQLKLGVLDDADETYFNGKKIGGTGGMPPAFDGSDAPWTKMRSYQVPASLVTDGENVIAVRIFNNLGNGGMTNRPPSFGVVGPFSPESPGGAATGHTLGGIGWYRKHFKTEGATDGRLTSVIFDGVYMDSDVWINGRHLGNHPYGYTAFAYELTPFLKPDGEENVISVRVRNQGRTSRWYSGSGIYRHVTLVNTSPVHVAHWGASITTPKVSKSSASVHVLTTVENTTATDRDLKIAVKLKGPDGKVAKSGETSTRVVGNGRSEIPIEIVLESPALWSPGSPALYQAEISLISGDGVLDQVVESFGIRDIQFSAAKGFTLNGEPMEIRGACLHHDNGPLGAAAIDRAEYRRVELMKSLGYNAIRTSHNPPSAVFLDACDRLGMLVMDEAFDCWEKGKNPDDYSKYFKDFWKKDLTSMILRDRNHPSIILWSIGNEIPQRADERGYEIAKELADEVRRLDPTRPVTEAICNFWDQPGRPWSDTEKAFTFVDVGGYNYEPSKYEEDHAKFPDRIMLGTESYPPKFLDYWKRVEKHSYVIGDFIWTGMDYIGESGCAHMRLDNEPGGFGRGWPWFNAFCGDLDICGFKKPQSYFRDVVWGSSQLEMMVHRPLPEGRTELLSDWGWPDEVPGWTWPGQEGKKMQVSIYSSCDTIRLKLNGKEIATRAMKEEDGYVARLDVDYQPGELRVVGILNGKTVATKSLRTAGPAAKIRLVADRATIRADRNDLSYVAAEITDADGNLLVDSSVPLRFSADGAGELAAVGSGSPNKPESFRGPVRTTYHGRALAIVRPKSGGGQIKLRVESPGLESAEIQIRAE